LETENKVRITQAKNRRGKFLGEKIFRRQRFFRVSHNQRGCFFRAISLKNGNDAGKFPKLESIILKIF